MRAFLSGPPKIFQESTTGLNSSRSRPTRTPALVACLRRSREPGNVALVRPLAVIYLASGAVVVAGPVAYPFTLWQMEVILLITTAILYLGLLSARQPFRRAERWLLILIHTIYLLLRVFRMIF